MTAFEQLRAGWQPALRNRLVEHVQRMGWSGEQIRAHQRERLRGLLAFALEHSPFHRERLGGIDPSRFELEDLPRLPVMTKADMMGRLDDVFTDRRLSLAAVEEALAATGEEPVPIHGAYVAMASGGSSGRRGVFVLDQEGMLEFIGSLARSLFAKLSAMALPGPMPVVMVGAASAVHATRSAPTFSIGADLPFIFRFVPVTLPLDELVRRLNALDAPLLYGYPSLLAILAEEKQAGRLRINPRGVTSTSETLTQEVREKIHQAFGAPLVNTFGSTEGLVGTSAPDDPVMVFNGDGCVVELVDEENRPVADGVPSAKVLVTNLGNRAQPLIRYELTDRFVRHPGEGHLRATVEGRADDVLHFGSADVHPHAIRAVLVKTPAVIDYQVRQLRRGVEVIAQATGRLDLPALRSQIVAALDAAGLPDAEVAVRTTSALERNSQTGKLRRIIPLEAAGG